MVRFDGGAIETLDKVGGKDTTRGFAAGPGDVAEALPNAPELNTLGRLSIMEPEATITSRPGG